MKANYFIMSLIVLFNLYCFTWLPYQVHQLVHSIFGSSFDSSFFIFLLLFIAGNMLLLKLFSTKDPSYN